MSPIRNGSSQEIERVHWIYRDSFDGSMCRGSPVAVGFGDLPSGFCSWSLLLDLRSTTEFIGKRSQIRKWSKGKEKEKGHGHRSRLVSVPETSTIPWVFRSHWWADGDGPFPIGGKWEGWSTVMGGARTTISSALLVRSPFLVTNPMKKRNSMISIGGMGWSHPSLWSINHELTLYNPRHGSCWTEFPQMSAWSRVVQEAKSEDGSGGKMSINLGQRKRTIIRII